ncbi:MAG: TonB-dependent receptor [Calditrichaeota bacterium]|nr:MAG: TonB-dependent receptor [Calditrichota bacterium]
MVKKWIQLTCLLAILLWPLKPLIAGNTGKLAGIIKDAETGEPLPGANIIILAKWENEKEIPLDIPLGAASDLEGEYYVLNLRPGFYTVEVSYVGYRPKRITKVEIITDKTTLLNVNLESETLSTETIEVVYEKRDVEKDLTATRMNYNVQQVKEFVGVTEADDILALQPDVADGHFRGGRSGEANYLLGGASIVNPLTNEVTFQPMIAALEQIDVYTSGFSAEYGNVQSGVINMVTKEASSKWETRIEVASTNSYYKTFGGSVYDLNNLPFFKLLNNPEEWIDGKDPKSGKILWTHFGINFPDYYGPKQKIAWPMPPPPDRSDSLRVAMLIYTFWRQAMQDAGLEYAKPDYRFDFTTGGPLTKKISMFLAGRQNAVNPILPSPNPNIERQFMGNIVYRLDNKNKIKFEARYNKAQSLIYSSNYFNWFERTLQVTPRQQTAMQLGVNWDLVYSPATFLNFKLNYLNAKNVNYVNLLGDTLLADIYTDYSNWRFYTTPSGHTVGKFNTLRGFDRSQVYNFQFSVISQVDKRNLVKSGFQWNYYDINVNEEMGFTNESSLQRDKYHVYPYEGAFYVQDKMEFQGLIANIGLRLDFYNMNVNYYTDKYSPYRNPNFNPQDPENRTYLDKNLAAKERTKLNFVFQPRLGFSFPITAKTVLHMNYGVFSQRPAFEYVFINRTRVNTSPDYIRLGNPELKPENTLSYELGLVHVLPFGLQLNVSAYLKDVNNLIQHAVYTDSLGYSYETFDNREYADIKGFSIGLEKRYGNVTGSVRYNLQYATGKSAAAIGSSIRAKFYENNPASNELPAPEDIFLDYDRRHIVAANLMLKSPESWDKEIFGFTPFKNLQITSTYRYQSGRPFTWDPEGKGLRYNQRTPDEHNLQLRVQKRIDINNVGLLLYCEVFNVLNEKVYYYSRLFSENQDNPYIKIYMQDRKNVFIDPEYAPYTTGIKGYLIGNEPRHYRFGLVFEF